MRSPAGESVGSSLPPDLTDSIRKVHDFLTVGAAAPLQQAGVVALGLPRAYYDELQRHYTDLRDRSLVMLEAAGFQCFRPSGAYYIMTDISDSRYDDVSFVRHMIEHAGVAAVPARASSAILPREAAL